MRTRSIGILSACVLFSVGGVALPAPVTFEFSGEITNIRDVNDQLDGIEVGTMFSGQYTFESTAEDIRPLSSTIGQYDNSVLHVAGILGSHGFGGAVNDVQGTIFVFDDVAGGDGYSLTASNIIMDSIAESFTMTIGFGDASGSIFSNDSLILMPPVFGELSSPNFQLHSTSESIGLSGSLASLSYVPEPATFALLLPAFLAILRRRA